jgi:hypothetical protein
MKKLLNFKKQIENNGNNKIENSDRISLTKVRSLYHVEYYGDPFEENYIKFLDIICEPNISEKLLSIDIKGPDEGSNGTRNWDLSAIGNSKTMFNNLEYFSIEKTKPNDHNRSIIGESYEENGILAKIIKKCPKLRVLISPSAPNPDFFENEYASLEKMNISTGYNHQNFIKIYLNLTVFRC